MRGLSQLDLDDGGLDRRRIAIAGIGNAARERGKLHRLQEADQLRAVLRFKHQGIEFEFQRHIGPERHQLAGNAGEFGIGDDVFAALLLLDLAGTGQQRIEIAEFFQQLRRRLRADAGNAGDVVDRIAGHGLQVDHLLGRHAPFLDDIGNANLLVLHAVIHVDHRRDELHQVLVGRDDRHIGTGSFGLAGIGGDDIIGFETVGLDAGQIEGAGRLADETELRDQLFRGRRTVCLVIRKDLLAERLRGVVENDGKVGRRHPDRGIARRGQKLPQHVTETGDGTDRQSVGLARQRRQGVKGPEYETGTVDEEEMITFFHGSMDSVAHFQRPYKLQLCRLERLRFSSTRGNALSFVLRNSGRKPAIHFSWNCFDEKAKSLTETLLTFNQSNLRIPLKKHIRNHKSYSPAIDTPRV